MKNKGISLIILVITIIVMIVLASAIILSLNSSGIIGNAKEAKENYRGANLKERIGVYRGERELDITLGKQSKDVYEIIESLIKEGLITESEAEIFRLNPSSPINVGDIEISLSQFINTGLKDDDLDPSLKAFITVWRVNAGGTVVLPLFEKINYNMLGSVDASFIRRDLEYDFYVDYGDGTGVYHITSYNDENAKHTYTNAGDYEVKITGKCEGFSFYQQHGQVSKADTNSNQLISIKQFGAVGFVDVSFDNARNLNCQLPEPVKNTFKETLLMPFMFRTCSLTGTIPANFLKGASKAVVICNIFSGQSGLTGAINDDFFSNCFEAISFQSVFFGCRNLNIKLTENIFKNNRNLKSLFAVFNYCSNMKGEIPEELLKNNTKLEIARQLFAGCTGLTGSIPENLFKYNTKLEDARLTFAECTGLRGSIPGNLFSNNPDLAGVEALFQQATGLTGSIPENLFKNNTKIKAFGYAFNAAVGLTGEIPENLFRYNTEAVSFNSVFSGCIGLTTIPSNLFEYNTKANNFNATFSNVDEDGDAAPGIDVTTQMNFIGTAPKMWERSITGLTGVDMYRGCTKLSNYADIPEVWK
ncbi:MAG: hypothetical protein PHD20_01960 [Clostridia bacterium]|nr:hypothetical protein [Clostridia bacterium]